jgi:hypothetical protein
MKLVNRPNITWRISNQLSSMTVKKRLGLWAQNPNAAPVFIRQVLHPTASLCDNQRSSTTALITSLPAKEW